jgi:hypothetical protein
MFEDNTMFEDLFESVYNGNSSNMEMALLRIKEAGATQMQSALVLIKKLELSIKDADYLIAHSDAWKGNKDAIINVRNQFGDFLEGIDES